MGDLDIYHNIFTGLFLLFNYYFLNYFGRDFNKLNPIIFWFSCCSIYQICYCLYLISTGIFRNCLWLFDFKSKLLKLKIYPLFKLVLLAGQIKVFLIWNILGMLIYFKYPLYNNQKEMVIAHLIFDWINIIFISYNSYKKFKKILPVDYFDMILYF